MIYPHKHINRADGGDSSPYAFGTLWQEITNGISSIGNTIVNGLQVTEKTKQLHDLYDIKGRQDWSVDVLNTTKPNNGSSIILAFVAVAVLATVAFVAIKNQKK